VLIATTFIKLTGDWLYFNRHQNELLKLQKQHIQTQLTALRSQINPHFLFNALNVIYAMSLDQKEKMTQAIVELSDILRYVIYDTNTDRVKLKDEVQLLKNYIAFQKHRVKDTPVRFEMSIENGEYKIYPMLLLPLLENAYKYGSSSEKEIKIFLTENEEHFKFSILNSKVNKKNIQDGSYSGIGLSTLQENLELVYKNNYTIGIVDVEDSFKVELTLNKA
jgi:sensor histidine kinase YesM